MVLMIYGYKDSHLNRYIEQCQELLDAPISSLEKRNLETYAQAVHTGRGEGLDDWVEDYEVPKDLVAYVDRSSTDYLDGARKEPFPVTFNYERWLRSS